MDRRRSTLKKWLEAQSDPEAVGISQSFSQRTLAASFGTKENADADAITVIRTASFIFKSWRVEKVCRKCQRVCHQRFGSLGLSPTHPVLWAVSIRDEESSLIGALAQFLVKHETLIRFYWNFLERWENPRFCKIIIPFQSLWKDLTSSWFLATPSCSYEISFEIFYAIVLLPFLYNRIEH